MVDLDKLPSDEEWLRQYVVTSRGDRIQNVLDALNLFRCRAAFADQELTRVNGELIEVRNSAEHNRIFGRERS